jgi:ABC-2 type transport system ATP-binding protein
VALAFVGRPRLVLLDEPTTGLDVDGRRTLWDAIRRQHRAGATVVVTSHYLEEIEALAERVVVIDGGQVIADDTVAQILSQVGVSQVRLRTAEPERVTRLGGIVHRERTDDREVLTVADADRFVRDLVGAGVDFHDLTVRGASLEEAFLALTAREPAVAAAPLSLEEAS